MKLRVLFISLLLLAPLTPSISATPPKTGAICNKAGITKNYNGKKYTCIKSGKKLVWNKGVVIKIVAPTPTPTITNTQTPTTTPTQTITPTNTTTPTTTPTKTPTPTPTPVVAYHLIGSQLSVSSASTCSNSMTIVNYYTYISQANTVPVNGAVVYQTLTNGVLYNPYNGGNKYIKMKFGNSFYIVRINSSGSIIDFALCP